MLCLSFVLLGIFLGSICTCVFLQHHKTVHGVYYLVPCDEDGVSYFTVKISIDEVGYKHIIESKKIILKPGSHE